MLKLLNPCSKAHEPQLLSPYAATTEALATTACALQQKKPLQWRVAPTYHNYRKPMRSNKDSVQSKIKNLKLNVYEQIQTCANQGREGKQKRWRSSQGKLVQTWGRVLAPPWGIYTISLSSSLGTKAYTQADDGNFRMSTRFLEHQHVTSLPINQKKVIHFVHPQFCLKNLFQYLWGVQGFWAWAIVLLAWPCSKPCSAPNSDVLACLTSLCLVTISDESYAKLAPSQV